MLGYIAEEPLKTKRRRKLLLPVILSSSGPSSDGVKSDRFVGVRIFAPRVIPVLVEG